MRVNKWRPILGLGVLAIAASGSAVLFARQTPAGSVVPAKFFVLNKLKDEAIPINIAAVDPKFPGLPVAIVASPDMDLSERTINRIKPLPPPPPPTWEYRIIPVSESDPLPHLSAAGNEGWELVNILTISKGSSFVLKRARR